MENLHLLLELVGAQTDDIFPLPEGNHDPEGAPFHRHDAAGRLVPHAVDGNPLDLDAIDETGQKKLLAGHPGAIARSNHGYFRGPGCRGDNKNSKTNKNTPCDKDALQQTCRRQWPVAALWITKNAFQVLFLPPLFFSNPIADT